MLQANAVLADEKLLDTVHHALQQRRPRSRTHGRPGTPAEVVLRMLVLKRVRGWSFDETEREVRSSLVYRYLVRVYFEGDLGCLEAIEWRYMALSAVRGRRAGLDVERLLSLLHCHRNRWRYLVHRLHLGRLDRAGRDHWLPPRFSHDTVERRGCRWRT